MLRRFFKGSAKSCLAVMFATVLLLVIPAGSALAHAVTAHINLSEQRMDVSVNGLHYASWAISSGRNGYRTPTGSFKPQRLKRMHYSTKYDDAPMPHSIFFYKGYAIHGTDQVRRLGRPASHGCVRLHPQAAAELYALVKQYGRGNTTIRVTY